MPLPRIERAPKICGRVHPPARRDELAYELDGVEEVEPDETRSLAAEEGQDLVTLVTCTPYGVNTQRLLERGHRVDGMGDEGFVTALDEVSRSLGLKGKIALTLLALIVVLGIVRALRGQAARRDSHEGVHFRD